MSNTLILKNQEHKIENKLINIFVKHIGYNRSIHMNEIFEKVLGVHPFELDIYKREFLWNGIKRIIQKLRKENKIYVIHKGMQWFVLKSENECSEYCNRLQNSINGLKQSSKNAKKWIEGEKWKYLKVVKGGDDNERNI